MPTTVRVAVVNYSCKLDDEAVTSGITALQAQVSDHLAPVWNVDAELFRLEPPTPCAGVYGLMLRDGTPDDGLDQGTAEATSHGLPLAHVFLGDLPPSQHWTHAASRELLNLLVDPIVSRMVYRQLGDGPDQRHRLYVHDIVAPCATYAHGYDVAGWRVADFVHEAWFVDEAPHPKAGFDHQRRIRRAFELLPGERVYAYDLVQDAWVAIDADPKTGELKESAERPQSLRARRLVAMLAEARARVLFLEACGGKHLEGGIPGGP